MIVCFVCRGKVSHKEIALSVDEGNVCAECFSISTVRAALLCDLQEAQAPLCWICSGELDHRHASVHVGDWVVCLRCYREYTSGRLFCDHDDYNWLMSQIYETDRFARALRQADEDWLDAQVSMLEFERGES